MVKKNTTTMELKLLKEAIWNIEDKVAVILESMSDHEVELLKLKRSKNISFQKLFRRGEAHKKNKNGEKA